MRHTAYAIVSVISITIIGYGAARGIGIWGVFGPPPGISPGTYRSVIGTQFFDDPRDIRPALAYDLALLGGSTRPILGGTVEATGTFRIERTVPFGAEIKVLSGRYKGDQGYIKSWELSSGRVRRIGDLTSVRKGGTR